AGFGQDGKEIPVAASENKTQVDEESRSGKSAKTGAKSLLNPERNYLCAPMINADADILGMVVVVLEGTRNCEKHQLVVLQSMAQLVLQAIQSIRLVERSMSPSVSIPLDPETHGLSTRSLRMQEIYNSARRSAEGRGTILITGEGGTGKETLARYIHQNSPYANGPFVSINCSSL